jgi:outer membrane protein TolC
MKALTSFFRSMFTISIFIILVISGCAGSRQLETDWKQYRLPPLATGYAGEPSASVEQPVVDLPEKAEIAELSNRKTRWASLFQKPVFQKTDGSPAKNGSGLFGIDAEKLAALSASAADDASAGRIFSHRWDLDTAKAVALLRNPSVQAAGLRFKAAIQALDQVTALDAVLKQYNAYSQTVMSGVGPMKGAVPIQMQFPFPGITALKGDIVDQNIRAAAADLDARRRDTLAAVESVFWNLHYTHTARRITAEMLDLLRHLEGVANTRYESGRISYQDVIKIRIQRDILSEDLATWQQRRLTAEARLKQLLLLPLNTTIAPPEFSAPVRKVPDLNRLIVRARQERQELIRMRAMIAKMEGMVLMAETMILPSYGPDFSSFSNRPLQTVGSGAAREPFSLKKTAQRGAGLPKMPWFGTQDAYLHETRRKLEALRRDLADSEARTEFRVHDTWRALDQAVREERLYRQSVVSMTETSLDVSTREYESGDLNFADVIGSYTLWLKSRLSLARKTADIGRFRAELLRWVGGPLDDRI